MATRTEEAEFGPLLGFSEVVVRLAAARGVTLPADMIEAAKDAGIREVILLRYFDLRPHRGHSPRWSGPSQCSGTECSPIRHFSSKLASRRGEDFWAEFELYAADILIRIVVDIALVGMLAPYVRLGKASASTGLLGRFNRMTGALPSSVLKLKGQAADLQAFCIAQLDFSVVLSARNLQYDNECQEECQKTDEDIPVPPLIKVLLFGAPGAPCRFNLTCDANTYRKRLLLSSPNVTVDYTIFASGFVSSLAVNILRTYGAHETNAGTFSAPWDGPGRPFAISGVSNMPLFVLGCGVTATLLDRGAAVGNCSVVCAGEEVMRRLPNGLCVGVGCCRIDLRVNLRAFAFNLSRTGGDGVSRDKLTFFVTGRDRYVPAQRSGA
ncbi:hypothetical protein ZWY2020_047906 [Hordeum vulgare]|nr:hypothetical protein ZWY2020_047906 [Hordeum vulgare]